MQKPAEIILSLVLSAAMLSASLVQPSTGHSEQVEPSDGVVRVKVPTRSRKQSIA